MDLRRIVAVTKEKHIQHLAQGFCRELFAADDMAEALDIIHATNPDLILFDHRFTPSHISDFLNVNLNNSTNIPTVVIGDDSTDDDLVEKFKWTGIFDYLNGRRDYNRFEHIIKKIKEQRQTIHNTKENSDFFTEEVAACISMVGKSISIQNTLKMIKLVSASKCNPILVVGETGTGKELAVRAIHILRSPNEPYVAINCAALTANLLESELFGHVKGSFTGADRDKIGLLELAGNGTILLDEISEMPIELQAKLLRVLQEKTFRKVGGTKTITCNATIIATSNRNLQKEAQDNRFRPDLYHRLNISPIAIAPLKSAQRRDDIPLLAEYFLKTSTICPEKQNKITSLTRMAVEALQKYDWPGNVRELHNVIERAILIETTEKIGLGSIVFDPMEYAQGTNQSTGNYMNDFSLEKAERELICGALRETSWQKTKAAALLGITRATLYAKVKQYNITKGSYADTESQNETPSYLMPQPVSVP